jgi:phosphopantothenoylcysteine synthetase/decarboxylase
MIAANEVGHEKGFDCEDNQLIVLSRTGRQDLGRASKLALARELVRIIGESSIAARAPAAQRALAAQS